MIHFSKDVLGEISGLLFLSFVGHRYINSNPFKNKVLFSSVVQSCLILCNPMDCSMPGLPVHHQFPIVYSNSCPLSQWCHPTISSSVVPFSHLQSFPVSGSFPTSQFFVSGGQSIGVSALTSVFPMDIQD